MSKMAVRKSNIVRKDEDEICELEHLRKLFVGGLAPYTSEDGLRDFYGQYGKVVDCIVMRDPTTKKSRGFGFVTFSKASMVDRAQDARPHNIDGKNVETRRALPRPERENSESNATVRKIFIGGLKDNHDEECLREHFSQFGNILNIKIVTDKTTGKRRGFAYIEFDDYDAVDKAILQKTHSIKFVLVDVKKSVYKQEMMKRAANSGNNNQSTNAQTTTTVPPPPVPPVQGGPPSVNYNWGPPPNYNGYYQQPPPNTWNWNQPPQNTWNGAPPPQGPWNQGNYGPPPPQANWNSGPPQGNWNSGPPPPQANWNGGYSAPPQGNWSAGPPVAPQNLGTGYQQTYSGGAQKANVVGNPRKNPYNVSPGKNDNQQQHQQQTTNGMNGRRY